MAGDLSRFRLERATFPMIFDLHRIGQNTPSILLPCDFCCDRYNPYPFWSPVRFCHAWMGDRRRFPAKKVIRGGPVVAVILSTGGVELGDAPQLQNHRTVHDCIGNVANACKGLGAPGVEFCRGETVSHGPDEVSGLPGVYCGACWWWCAAVSFPVSVQCSGVYRRQGPAATQAVSVGPGGRSEQRA